MTGNRAITTLLTIALLLPFGRVGAQEPPECGDPPATAPLTFDEPDVFDLVRAGGEPSVEGHPDGTLLYAAHASTTLFYRTNMPDPDYITPYTGSTYVWRSTDRGDTWRYVGLADSGVGPHAATISGFSDPDFAIDAAGNVYTAGINLANVYVAKSGDSGRTWNGHAFAALATDREWLAADEPDVVYMNGNSLVLGRTLWKSKDGGLTWDSGHDLQGGGPPSKIEVDPADGRLYYPVDGGEVQIFPNIRNDDFTSVTVGSGVGGAAYGGFQPMALDGEGNVYIVGNTQNTVRVAYSTDRGATWSDDTIYQAPPGNSVMWPWISAGDDGRVGVSWFQADKALSTPDSQSANWRVVAAQTQTGHGWTDLCGVEHPPIYDVEVATPQPFHTGTVCTGGTFCQVGGIDRRLGDYHTNSISADGKLLIAYSDTSRKPGGAISHPGFVRQSGGVDFVDEGPEPTEVTSLDASAAGGTLSVSGAADFGGQAPVLVATDAAGDPPAAQASTEAGIDLLDTEISQPDPDDPTLRFDIHVTKLPVTGSLPEVVRYTVPFKIGTSQWQVQAKLTNLTSVTVADDPQGHVRPPGYFQLRGNCTTAWQGTPVANCPHIAWIDGELDPGTNTIHIEVPLGASFAPPFTPGAVIEKNVSTNQTLVDIMAAYNAVAATTAAADVATLENGYAYRIPTRDVLFGVAPAGTDPSGVTFSATGALGEGDTFAGDLDVSGLAPGEYELFAKACFADNCGVATAPFTI